MTAVGTNARVASHRLLAERAFARCERKVGLHGHDLRGYRREDGDDKDSEPAEEYPISRTGSPLRFPDLVRDEDRDDPERDVANATSGKTNATPAAANASTARGRANGLLPHQRQAKREVTRAGSARVSHAEPAGPRREQ